MAIHFIGWPPARVKRQADSLLTMPSIDSLTGMDLPSPMMSVHCSSWTVLLLM
jgi:hypothetical protein